MSVQIATWNVNSIDARLTHVLRFLKEKKPNIVFFQEIKCQNIKFPSEQIEDLGYNVSVFGQKSYNGVAIISTSKLEDVVFGIPNLEIDNGDARYLEAFTIIENIPIKIASVYVPNGSEIGSSKFLYKLEFLKALKDRLKYINQTEENIVIGGDFNVAPYTIDVYNPVSLNGSIGFNIEERKIFNSILNDGFLDSFRLKNPTSQEFSWWDYRSNSFAQDKGMRIDHVLLSPKAADMLQSSTIYRETRSWIKPSDHAPVLCNLKKESIK